MNNNFQMNPNKPINNNSGSHCKGNHDEVFNGTRLTPNGNWRPDASHMTKARPNRPWIPQCVPKRGT